MCGKKHTLYRAKVTQKLRSSVSWKLYIHTITLIPNNSNNLTTLQRRLCGWLKGSVEAVLKKNFRPHRAGPLLLPIIIGSSPDAGTGLEGVAPCRRLCYTRCMKTIELTQGKSCIVDEADYEYLNKFRWKFKKARISGYAYRTEAGKNITMHRELMGFPKGLQVDHRNGNKLDNRRSNLRVATQTQNARNRHRYQDGHSRYKGVTLAPHRTKKKWRAQIYTPKRTRLGYFYTEEAAARAYDKAAIRYFGNFARTNFPTSKDE